MATNNYPPIVSKYHGECTACGKHVRPGDRVNWTKGVKGVTCLDCPQPGATTNGTKVTTPTSAADPQLQASLADGRALRAQIGTLTSERDELRRQLESLAAEYARWRASSDAVSVRMSNVIDGLQRERNALRSRLCMVETPTEEPIDDGEELIDVMAPGGVERWLEHDLAQIAAEKAAKERQAIPVITDDCPI